MQMIKFYDEIYGINVLLSPNKEFVFTSTRDFNITVLDLDSSDKRSEILEILVMKH